MASITELLSSSAKVSLPNGIDLYVPPGNHQQLIFDAAKTRRNPLCAIYASRIKSMLLDAGESHSPFKVALIAPGDWNHNGDYTALAFGAGKAVMSSLPSAGYSIINQRMADYVESRAVNAMAV